jgi:hypothetical protein
MKTRLLSLASIGLLGLLSGCGEQQNASIPNMAVPPQAAPQRSRQAPPPPPLPAMHPPAAR